MTSLEEIHQRMSDFLRRIQNKSADKDYEWINFRSFFVKLANSKSEFSPTPQTTKLISKVKSISEFNEKFPESLFLSVFPELKYEYHLEPKRNEKINYIQKRYQLTTQYSMNNKTFSRIPEVDLSKIHAPKTTRSSCPRRKSLQNTTVVLDPIQKKIADELKNAPVSETTVNLSSLSETTPKLNFSKMVDQNDAIAYVSKNDDEAKDVLFQFGSLDKDNRYAFQVLPFAPIEGDFQAISKAGVMVLQNNGYSEFTTMNNFLQEKTTFNMISKINVFAQFKLYKSFNIWKIRTIRKLFNKKKDYVSDKAWITKGPLPPKFFEFRKLIQQLNQCELFPMNTVKVHYFNVIKRDFEDSAEKDLRIIQECSKQTTKLLKEFAEALYDKYLFESTPRSIDFIHDKKIPSELLVGATCLYKHGLSIVEEELVKQARQRRIDIAFNHVKALKPFMATCDQNIIDLMLDLFRRESKKLCDIFIKPNFEITFKVYLTFLNNSICLSPSFDEVKELINQTLELYLRYFHSYIRPICIDMKGEIHMSEEDMQNRTPLRLILKNDPIFNQYLNTFLDALKESYDLAYKTLLDYKNTTHKIYEMNNQWQTLKNTCNDLTVFINNLSDLNKLKESAYSFKMNYSHQMINLEAHALQDDLKIIVDKLIDDNNTILFRNYKIICQNIISDVKQRADALKLNGETLEDLAVFNLGISNAVGFLPELNNNMAIVHSIYDKALEMGDFLTPILSQSLDEVTTVIDNFKKVLNDSQNIMLNQKDYINSILLEQQKDIEKKIGIFGRQLRGQFSQMDPNQSPSVAISDINECLDKINALKGRIKEFVNTASRLNYSGYEFSQLDRTEAELKKLMQYWNDYQKFMDEFNFIMDSKMVEIDINRVLEFLGSYNEIDLKNINNSLFDRMAAHFSQLYEYQPLFHMISKVQFNPERWFGFCKIIEQSYETFKFLPIRKILNPSINERFDEIRGYILNMQQREDMINTFNQFHDEYSGLIFKFVKSSIAGHKIISFPILHEYISTCQNYLVYIENASQSEYFDSIKLRAEVWKHELNQAVAILNALIGFQSQYINMKSLTVSFESLHFSSEYLHIQHIKNWFLSFLEKITADPHIKSLIPRVEERLQSEINKNEIDAITSMKSLSAFTSQKSLMSQQSQSPAISSDILLKITNADPVKFIGDFLVNILTEATKRCNFVIEELKEMFDIQRREFPRLYFATDQQIANIILGCSNLKSSVDDLRPIFPSLSKVQISMADEESIVGITNLVGETYLFAGVFPVAKYSITGLLNVIEKEMKNSVKMSINDAYISREYTDISKWYSKYPAQSVLVSENAFFMNTINEVFNREYSKVDWLLLNQHCQESIKFLTKELQYFPDKSVLISLLLALKMRHRDILSDFESEAHITPESLKFRKHIFHTRSQYGDILVTYADNQSLPYYSELVTEPRLFPLSDGEEQAFVNYAHALTDPMLYFVKQFSKNRNVLKVFADFIAMPFFDISYDLMDNFIVAASKINAIINVNELPVITPQINEFFQSIGQKAKIVKDEEGFHQLSIQDKSFLIHLNVEEVPAWLKQRYRPVHLINEPNSELISKILQIKNVKNLPKLTDVDLISRVILRSNYDNIINQTNEVNTGNKKTRIFFDFHEFILTGKFVKFDEPVNIEIPETIVNKVNAIREQVHQLDTVSSKAYMQDFPIRAYSKPIMIVCPSVFIAQSLIYLAFGEKIHKITITAQHVSDSVCVITIAEYRPIYFAIFKNIDEQTIDAIIINDWTVNDYASILAQEKHIVQSQVEYKAFVEGMVQHNEHLSDAQHISMLIKNTNIIRYIIAHDNSISISKLMEFVFTHQYKQAMITEAKILKIPMNSYMPFIVSGSLSSGKRSFTKDFVNERKLTRKDAVFYSSSFNDNLNKTIFQALKFISRGLYGPKNGKELWICIFDYQNAIPEIKEFVKAFMAFKAIKNPVDGIYYKVERIRLMITTSDPKPFYDMKIPIHIIEQQDANKIDWSKLETNIIFGNNLEIVKSILETYDKPAVVKSFIEINQNIDTVESFFRVFSIFFGIDLALKVAKCYAITEQNIIEFQNHNFSAATLPRDFNFVSIIHEVILLHINAIMVLDTFCYFRWVKNTEFVVLDGDFKVGLFKALVKVSQNKTRTTFIIDMNILDWNTVFNYLNFFMYNSEAPSSSTVFDQNEFIILSNYINSEGTTKESFDELLKLINFFVICDEDQLLKIPELFRGKMIVLRPNKSMNDSVLQSTNQYIERVAPYCSLKNQEHDTMARNLWRLFNDRFSDLTSEINIIIQFMQNITSLKSKLDIGDKANTMEEISESDLAKRVAMLDSKLKDCQAKEKELTEIKDENLGKLTEINKLLQEELPEKYNNLMNYMKNMTLSEQAHAIKQWLTVQDSTFCFTNIFKDIFGIATTSNFGDPSQINPQYSLLVHNLSGIVLDSIDPNIVAKIAKFNLKGENNYTNLMKSSNFGETKLSNVPIANNIVGCLCYIVQAINLQDERKIISQELTNLNSRIKTNKQLLNGYRQQFEEASETMKRLNGVSECPSWLLKAWENDSNDVKRLFSQIDSFLEVINYVLTDSIEAERLIKQYTAIQVAYSSGISALNIEKRKELLTDLGLTMFLSPFDFVKHHMIMQMFFPVKNIKSLFTICDSEERTQTKLSMKTAQIFNVIEFLDLIAFNNLLPLSPIFYNEKERDNTNLIPEPMTIYYDPQNICQQLLIANYNCKILFTSSEYLESLISAISAGETIIVVIDSLESGLAFCDQISNIQILLQATRTVQYKNNSKPVTFSFRMFVISLVPKEGFANKKNVTFADFSMKEPENTLWFEIACVLSSNKKLFDDFVTSIDRISTKTIDFYQLIQKLTEMSHDSWPEYFDNNLKMMNLRKSLDSLVQLKKDITSSCADLDMVLKEIHKFTTFVTLCKYVVKDVKSPNAVFQLLLSIKDRAKTNMTPQTSVRDFEEILVTFTSLLPAPDRLHFIANFEHYRMKEFVDGRNLLLQGTFPNIHSKQLRMVMPQLINHITSILTLTPKTFFTHPAKANIPQLNNYPVVIAVDKIIPADYVAKFVKSSIKAKSMVIGSFYSQILDKPQTVDKLIQYIKGKGEVLIIIVDELLDYFMIPSILNFTHIHNFTSFYFIIPEELLDRIPIIPSALYYKFSRPCTIGGISQYIEEVSPNVTEMRRYDGPLIYLLMTISQRNDCTIPMLQIPAIARTVREIFTNGKFGDDSTRETVEKFTESIICSYFDDEVLRESILTLIKYFFSEKEPRIPGVSRVDINNDAVYKSETPIIPVNSGMTLNFGELVSDKEPFGWREKIGSQTLYFELNERQKPIISEEESESDGFDQNESNEIIEEKNDEELYNGTLIKRAKLSNALLNNGYLSIIGDNLLDIYAYKKNLDSPRPDNLVKVGVYDGNQYIGYIYIPCTADQQIWQMSAIRLYLPEI